MTVSSSSQNRDLMKHISGQFGHRFGRETETCSQSIPDSGSPELAITLSSRLHGPGMRNARKSSKAFEPYGPFRIRHFSNSVESLIFFAHSSPSMRSNSSTV